MKILVDLDDYKFRFSQQYGWSISNVIFRVKKNVGHMLSRRTLKRFSGAFVATNRDLDEVVRVHSLETCFLPNVANIELKEQIQANRPQVLFVGSLWYGPNAHGVDWFLSKVWPLVLVKVSNATMLIVGSVSSESRRRWEDYPSVRVPGFVDDLATAYAESAVVVVPIQAGGGSNIKVLEAMGHKRPCVVSTFVASAFSPQLQPSIHVREADGPEQFASQICEVLVKDNVFFDDLLVSNAHTVIIENFLPSIFISKVKQFVLNIISNTKKEIGG